MAALKKQVIATAASLLLGGPTSVAAVKSGVFHHDTDSTSTNAGASTTKPAPTQRTNASQATPVSKKNGVTVIDVDANGSPISGARSGGGSGSTGGSGSSGGSGGASSGGGSSSSTGSGDSGSGSGGSSSSTPGSTKPSTTGSAPGTPSSTGGNCTTTVKAQSDNKSKDSDDDKKTSGSSKGRESDDHDDDDDDRDHTKQCTTLPPVTTVKPPVTVPVTTTKPPVTTAPPTTAPPTTAPPTTAPPTTAPPTTAPAPALTLSQNFTSVTKGTALGFTTTVANNQSTDANVSLTIKVSSATLPNYLEALGTGWSCSAYVAKPVATATYTCTGMVAAKSSSVVTVSSGSLIPASAAGQSITASATATPGNVTVSKTAVYA